MKSLRLLGIATATLFLLVLTLPGMTSGQESGPTLVRSDMPDWPQWRGAGRDGISHETGLLSAWPAEGPTELWTAEGIGRGFSAPIVANGTIYITGDEGNDLVISAFALDGKLQWQVKNGASWQGSFPGARASCTYSDGKLYHMNAQGRLACLDAKTGTELWAVNVLERFEGKNIFWGISESPLIHGDLVFATPSGAKALVVALNKDSGETVWTTPAIADEQPSYASPILVKSGGRTLLINSANKNAFAVDAKTGELCWSVSQEDPKNAVSTIPVLADNEVIITNASRSFGAVFGVRLDGSQGEKSWVKKLGISHGSTVSVDGQVYGHSARGEARGWVAVDAETGSVRPMSELGGGSLTYADGRFYCLTEKGTMALLKPTDDKFETVGSFQFAEGKDVWAHPVICHGKLYLRFHEKLHCFDIRS